MDKLSRDPFVKEGWYQRWHNHPRQHFWQWVFLILVVGSVGWILIDRIREPELVSYSLSSRAANSKNQNDDKLFSGVAGYHEQSPFGTKAELMDVEIDQIERGLQHMQIQLPDGPTIVVNLKNLERRGQGNVAWRGSVEGREDSSVTLTLKNGFLAGTIRAGKDLYEIRPAEGKNHVVEKMDPTLFPAEIEPKGVTFSSDTLALENLLAPAIATANDGVIQIDLLSVYTPQAKAAAGGDAQIDALIQAAVDNANTAFINSQINAHYNLVATSEVAYNDSGTTSTDLSWLQSNSAVATLRNQYGADMVSMIVQNGGSACGTGYLMGAPSSSFAPYAFQVTDMDCAVGNLTFAHEHGHNIGMSHDPANAGGAYFAWSYGHFVNSVFRTVMSYPGTCGCTRVPYFSNPNVIYAGYPTGIPDQRDNAKTANLTISTVSAFRGSSSSTSTTPSVPSNLTSLALSSTQIKLNWLDNSADELGFKIQRSQDGINFVEVASTGANVVNYTNTNLSASTSYYYRVIAYNGAGDSSPSNISNTTTQTPDLTAPVVAITKNGVANKTLYNITATATDNVAVKSIQIVVGGVLKKTCNIKTPTANPSPCSVSLKISSVTNGSSIIALAIDTSGNIGQVAGIITK